jgi:hypothetical protein
MKKLVAAAVLGVLGVFGAADASAQEAQAAAYAAGSVPGSLVQSGSLGTWGTVERCQIEGARHGYQFVTFAVGGYGYFYNGDGQLLIGTPVSCWGLSSGGVVVPAAAEAQ